MYPAHSNQCYYYYHINLTSCYAWFSQNDYLINIYTYIYLNIIPVCSNHKIYRLPIYPWPAGYHSRVISCSLCISVFYCGATVSEVGKPSHQIINQLLLILHFLFPKHDLHQKFSMRFSGKYTLHKSCLIILYNFSQNDRWHESITFQSEFLNKINRIA